MMLLRLAAPLHRLRANTRASLSVEMAILAPMMLILALATTDLVGYILTAGKVTRVSAQTANAVASNDIITDAANPSDDDDDDGGSAVHSGTSVGIEANPSIDSFFIAANEIAASLNLEDAGRVIISSVANVDGTGPRIMWQRTGDYDLSVESNLGAEGEIAKLPDPMIVNLGENLIVAEVFYQFDPMVLSAGLLSGGSAHTVIVERMSTFRPRLAPLKTLQ